MSLMSPWGEKLDPTCPLPEYPRMLLQRSSYTNLNGMWEFQITGSSEKYREDAWERICVPFALGSKLSLTDKQLQPGQVLWYRRRFRYEARLPHTLLNFEAVDQVCEVFLNGLPVGGHRGGYAPFSLDVSGAVLPSNELIVRCTDDSDTGLYAYGKQRLKHGGMWYTPSSGIWQTVWMEDVSDGYVQDIRIQADYDTGDVSFQLSGNFSQAVISVAEDRKIIGRGVTNDGTYVMHLDRFRPWSPDDPFLYDVYVQTEDDTIKSYFGMRKFSAARDANGCTRFCLNGKPLFLSGLLDQGYSVDGLMTYPSDEAMEYELSTIRALGFNMLRKHVKVECRRWYYHCDQLGILVMQDMPNGGGPYQDGVTLVWPTLGRRRIRDDQYEKFGRASETGRKIYYAELDAMLKELSGAVSVFAWVPFNEGWGQFDSAAVTQHIRQLDPVRLVDSASGWFDQKAGDFNSRHVYFRPFRAHPGRDERILLLSEFGGYSYLEPLHSEAKKLYGYRKYKDRLMLDNAVQDLYQKDILAQIPKGLCGCIYTQVSDVEDECNGLFTADRRILKIDSRRMRRINEKCIRGAISE
jgi:beta-galactosidase/beta-glucuronidase